MKNRDVYLKDPTTIKLANEGVANVNDYQSDQALTVLRCELETFVCDGQYEKGLQLILETYLKNIGKPHQPGAWVSGFYGSGKSHLVKMLRALWLDTKFPDGATARGITNLPSSIKDLLVELTTTGRRHGGLHAASGTLGAGASGSVRLALLGIILRSVQLPEQLHIARFVMWLKKEELFDSVCDYIKQLELEPEDEIFNFYFSDPIHDFLAKAKPNFFSSSKSCSENLIAAYPIVNDVSSEEMIRTIDQILSRDSINPLTLIILDEIQQFIGEDSQKAHDIQELVESCLKNANGKLLFVGTGQTAISGTPSLKRLEGRFTVRIELSDSDVDTVVRKVILAKKLEAKPEIESVMQKNIGEISRHLTNTTIGHNKDDVLSFAQDYPILPVRRRFWERCLRVLDETGTYSQLRNQLSMIHRFIQTNIDQPLGYVIPADLLFFESADKLLQHHILPRKVYESTLQWMEGSEEQKLTARACGLVFLINKLSDGNKEIGIKATSDAIADLLVDDLAQGSASLRSAIPPLLNNCEIMMKVGDEYRIQTPDSIAWHNEFASERNQIANEMHHIDIERSARVKQLLEEILKRQAVTQGISRTPRQIYHCYESLLPEDKDKKIYLWVWDGWSTDENSIIAEARQAGIHSPTVFIYLPKRYSDELRHSIIDFKASQATLEKRGTPNTPEGIQACESMKTIQQNADQRIREILTESLSNARVFQGGGTEILGNNLQEMVREAVNNSMMRLYHQFDLADNPGWAKVYEKASKGAPDALKAIGDEGSPENNQVCKLILSYIASGKKGLDVRKNFVADPYGWPVDAIDGALQVLLVAELIRALDERGQAINPSSLERRNIGKTTYKVESTVVPAEKLIQIRKIYQLVHLQARPHEESLKAPEFILLMKELAASAGGDPPKPEPPDMLILDEIRKLSGNEQLIAIANSEPELSAAIANWNKLSRGIQERWSDWETLNELLANVNGLNGVEMIQQQVDIIKQHRQLLVDPNPIQPLVKALSDLFRKELNTLSKQYIEAFSKGKAMLESESSWKELTEDERIHFFSISSISEPPNLALGTPEELISTLQQYPLEVLKDRIAAITSRFAYARELAIQSVEPSTQVIDLPRRTLKSPEDVDAWIKEIVDILKQALANGPVVIR